MSQESQNQHDKTLRDEIIRAVREHAAKSDGKVLGCIRIRWTQVGYDLAVNGYTIEYKDKPKKK